MNYAAEIKSAVSMRDVLSHFGVDTGRGGRIPCPLHHGKDNNFSYKDKSFRCYVCGASGTVLDFVMEYCGTDLAGAEQIINDQFGLNLPIGRKASRQERDELQKRARLRRLERERKEREHKHLQTAYDKALTAWVGMDKAIREKAPQSVSDGFDAAWVYAIKNIDRASYELDLADMVLTEFERRK